MGKTIRGKSKEQKARLIKGYQHNVHANRLARRRKAKQSGVFKQRGTWKTINQGSRAENRQTVARRRDRRGKVDRQELPTNNSYRGNYNI